MGGARTCCTARKPDSVRSMAARDEVLAVAAAHRLGFVRSDNWSMVAAHLLASGHDGEATTELAGLSGPASGWQVDQLVPRLLSAIGADCLDAEQAGEVMARLLAQVFPDDGHPVIRALAPLAGSLDYPGGRIGQAYYLDETLDYSSFTVCRPGGRRYRRPHRPGPATRAARTCCHATRVGADVAGEAVRAGVMVSI